MLENTTTSFGRPRSRAATAPTTVRVIFGMGRFTNKTAGTDGRCKTMELQIGKQLNGKPDLKNQILKH